MFEIPEDLEQINSNSIKKLWIRILLKYEIRSINKGVCTGTNDKPNKPILENQVTIWSVQLSVLEFQLDKKLVLIEMK